MKRLLVFMLTAAVCVVANAQMMLPGDQSPELPVMFMVDSDIHNGLAADSTYNGTGTWVNVYEKTY